MQDAPRDPRRPILPTKLLVYLVLAGLLMAVCSLGVIAWATPLFGEAAARSMGLVTFSLTNIWFALETNNEDRSIFVSALENPTLLKAAGIAALFTIAATEIGLMNRILDSVNLTVDQWITCFVVSLAVLVMVELKKLLKIRTDTPPATAVSQAAPVQPAPAA